MKVNLVEVLKSVKLLNPVKLVNLVNLLKLVKLVIQVSIVMIASCERVQWKRWVGWTKWCIGMKRTPGRSLTSYLKREYFHFWSFWNVLDEARVWFRVRVSRSSGLVAWPPIENMRIFPSCVRSTLIYYIHFTSVTLKIFRWNLLSKTVFGRLSNNEWLDESGWTTHYPYFPIKLIFWNLESTSWFSALPYFKYFSNLMEQSYGGGFT